MNSCVLDSSAVLALLLAEPGADTVANLLPDACMSTINFAEIVTKLCERGMPSIDARMAIEALGIDTVDFDVEQAVLTGELRVATRTLGLSLGDRACLALAQQRGVQAITADTAWSQAPNVSVVIIR